MVERAAQRPRRAVRPARRLRGRCSATAAPPSFWDAATFGLIEQRSQHLSFGEFSSKFAERPRPRPVPRRARGHRAPTRAPTPTPVADADVDALRPHPQRDLDRRGDAARAGPTAPTDDALVLVDATSAAGGLRFDPTRGRRLLLRPAEVPRLRRRALARRRARPPPSSASSASPRRDRWMPGVARPRHRPRQLAARTRPTTRRRWPRSSSPSQQVEWINEQRRARVGGRRAATARPRPSTAGPSASSYATPFVADPAERSHVVATIDLDDRVDANAVSRGAAGQRHRRHRVATASSAATSCASPCSRPSSPTTSPRSPRCIDHVVEALAA